MMVKLIKFIKGHKEKKNQAVKAKKRKILEKKVDQGTDFVIQQYGEALRKLGAYDRK
jgi:hypothetical protein